MAAEHIDPRMMRTRQLVLAAARDVAVDRGYGGLSIEGIARRAGVAKTSIYRQWRSPAELLLDAAEPYLAPPPRDARTPAAFAEALRRRWGDPEARGVVVAALEGARHDVQLAEACRAFVDVWRGAVIGVLPEGPQANAVADGVLGRVLVEVLFGDD